MPFGGIKVWAWLAVAGIATGAGAWLYSTVKDAGVRECRAKVDADTADLNDQLERLEEKYRDLTRAYLAMLEKTTALQSELDLSLIHI